MHWEKQKQHIIHDLGLLKQTWKTVNKQSALMNISLILQSALMSALIAECFSEYFTNIGPDIAKTIDTGDRNFMNYMHTTTSSFTFQTVSENKEYRLLLCS